MLKCHIIKNHFCCTASYSLSVLISRKNWYLSFVNPAVTVVIEAQQALGENLRVDTSRNLRTGRCSHHAPAVGEVVVSDEGARRLLVRVVVGRIGDAEDLERRLRHLAALHNECDEWLRSLTLDNLTEQRRGTLNVAHIKHLHADDLEAALLESGNYFADLVALNTIRTDHDQRDLLLASV